MKVKLFFTLLILSGFNARLFAQDCNCSTQFAFIKSYFETNNPSFQKIKTDAPELKLYKEKVEFLTKQINAERDTERCALYFERYVALLKDHHSHFVENINIPSWDSKQEREQYKLSARYKSYIKLKIDTTALIAELETKPLNTIEGLYKTSFTNNFIAVIKKNKNEYVGVALRDDGWLSEVGHVLMEFTRIDDDIFECRSSNIQNDLGPLYSYDDVTIENGRLYGMGLVKARLPGGNKLAEYEFRQLDSATNYLKLPSFSSYKPKEVDSFFTSLDTKIQQRENLVIDLRDCRSGPANYFLDLLKYINTQPLKPEVEEVWVTPEIIKLYESRKKNAELIARMKAATPFTFISKTAAPQPNFENGMEKFPKKVAILFNDQTRENAELLIYYALQSKKTITLGTNSGGHIGYYDVVTTKIPCSLSSVSTSTTKSEKSKYSFVGIAPQYNLTENEDWLEAAKMKLEKK